ncbi:hypothetical protein P3L10_003944 [Capsicum annuum]
MRKLYVVLLASSHAKKCVKRKKFKKTRRLIYKMMWAFGLLEKLDKCWTTLGFQVAYMGQPNSSFLRWARAIIPQDSVEFNH